MKKLFIFAILAAIFCSCATNGYVVFRYDMKQVEKREKQEIVFDNPTSNHEYRDENISFRFYFDTINNPSKILVDIHNNFNETVLIRKSLIQFILADGYCVNTLSKDDKDGGTYNLLRKSKTKFYVEKERDYYNTIPTNYYQSYYSTTYNYKDFTREVVFTSKDFNNIKSIYVDKTFTIYIPIVLPNGNTKEYYFIFSVIPYKI